MDMGKNVKVEKNGMMFGFITDTMLPAKWMIRLHELQAGVPSGMFWRYCWYEGKGYKEKGGYANARKKVVEHARSHNAEFLFFIDSVPGITPILIRNPDTKKVNILPIEELASFSNAFSDARGVEYDKQINFEVMVGNDKWSRVRKVIRHPYSGIMKRINTKGGIIEITPNHAIFRPGRNKGPVDVKNLEVGESVCMPRFNFINKKTIFFGTLDLAWMYGFFAAEGSCSKKDFSIANKRIELLEKCKNIFNENFQTYKHTFNMTCANGVYRIGCSHKGIRDSLEKEFYTRDKKKKVPESILNSSPKIKKAFLEGYNLGDGYTKGKNDLVMFTTNSKTLAAGLVFLLHSIGRKNINVNIRPDKDAIGIGINKHETKCQKINFRGQIKKIEEFEFSGKVYDLSTESERFCGGVGGFLLHNTDVFPPLDTLAKLFAANKPIVTGIYYMKTFPPQPVIYKKMGSGPYYDFPVEELVEIEGAGLGCCLIKMEVFDKFEEAGIPFFQENWRHEKSDGGIVNIPVGEDHYFFIKAKELGYKIYCDTSVLCDHLDVTTGAIFPGEEEVKKIRARILEKKGRKDILDKEAELYTLDPNRKTIVFYNATPSPFAGDELERRGVGGAEGCVISLAKIFARMYNVIVFCDCPRPGVYDGVKYLHVSDTEFMQKFKTDLFISSRNTKLLADVNFKEYFKVDKVCLWTHDLPESYVYDKLMQALPNIDRVFALTEWHKQIVKQKFPNVPEKYWFFARNGVNTEYYDVEVKRNPYKLIYSSTPFRGLDVLLEVFPKIREYVLEAELHVYSSMQVYGARTEEREEYKALYTLASTMPGVYYHGAVTRKELAKAMKSSALLAYPNHYPETCCITAMEAITAGTPIVTSHLAALPEIIPKGCAVLIDGDSKSYEYKQKFIDAVVGILKNPALWEEMHKACQGHDFTWETVSKEWVKEFFPDDIGKFSELLSNSQKKNVNTPEYWDRQYKYEVEKGIDQRKDPARWDIILDKIKDGAIVLDFGCARGEFLDYLSKKKPNCKLYGIDFSKFACEQIQKNMPLIRVSNDIRGFPVDAQSDYYDVVTSQHVIEHFDDPKQYIADMRKLLASTGMLILVVPINDDEWLEHQRIYQVQDVIELLNEFDCTYKVVHRKQTIRSKKDGRALEEAIFFIKFGSG